MNAYVEAIRKAYENGYRHFGVRASYDDELRVGDNCELSYDWDPATQEPTDETLDGTCATSIVIGCELDPEDEEDAEDIAEAIAEAIQKNSAYLGSIRHIIAGTHGEYGDDPDEIILSEKSIFGTEGAKVIAAIEG